MSDEKESEAVKESVSEDTTRREVLSAVGGVSMATPFAAGVDVNWGTDESNPDRVEYVERLEHTNHEEVRREGAVPERTEVTDTIPRDHWLVVETAYDARDRIQKLIEQRTTDPLIMTGVTTITDGGQSKKAITVDRVTQRGVDSTSSPDIGIDEINSIVPDTVAGSVDGTTIDGIPVITREQTHEQTTDCNGYNYTSSFGKSIPGAARYRTTVCKPCSFATPAVDNGTGERKMLTGGHCGQEGIAVHQPDCGGEYDGEFDQSFDDKGIDFGSVKSAEYNDGGDVYKYKLADEGGDFYPNTHIEGIIPQSSLKYHEGDQGYEIVNHGARTGRTTGYIKNIKTNSSGHDIIATTAQNGGGDSGCSMYKEYQYSGTTSVYIAGISVWGRNGVDGKDCPFEVSLGNTMEYIENKLNVKV